MRDMREIPIQEQDHTAPASHRADQQARPQDDVDHCTVYRFFNESSELLYVGITNRGRRRIHEHARTKQWWPHVHTAAFEHHPSRMAALDAEKRAIQAEHPTHNIIHNGHTFVGPDQILGGRPDLIEALTAQLKRNGYALTGRELIHALDDGTIQPDELKGIAPNLVSMIVGMLER